MTHSREHDSDPTRFGPAGKGIVSFRRLVVVLLVAGAVVFMMSSFRGAIDRASTFTSGGGSIRDDRVSFATLGPPEYSGEELDASFVFEQNQKGRQPALSVFQVGEELTYEVGYLLVKLGTIVARCTGIDTIKGKVYYRTECLMRSYQGVPLVSLWTKFQSTVDQSLGSVSFSAKEKYKDTTYKYIHYTYPRNRDVVYVSERLGNKPQPWNYDTLKLDGKRWQDGLSLLFYARAFALQHFTDKVPVLVYRTRATTTINFGVKEETQDIDAVKYPVRTMKLDGETGFTGIFGLTGGFEGWFSKDWAAVPIYAKMHVILGSVSVELIGWKKSGWTPPR